MNDRVAKVLFFVLTLLAVIPAFVGAESGFRLRRPLWIDNDTRSIRQPRERGVSDMYAIAYNTWLRHLSPEKAAAKKHPALNVNAWDEVPDSTWFTNRIGRARLSFEEIVKGIEGKPPEPPPWRVIRSNDAGYTPKVDILDSFQDSSARRYVLKLDPHDARERNSGAERIGTLIMYAAGYNVPHNTIAYFRPEDLQLYDKSYYRDPTGVRRPLTRAQLDAILKKSDPTPDGPHRGMYRGIASLYLGPPTLGPFVFTGRREDDQNDIIPHEWRRELRGLRVIGSWINHVDIKDAQAMDIYYAAPDGRQFVKHYLLDFSATLGAYEWPSAPYRIGHEYMFDASQMGRSLLSLGIYKRPWDVSGEVRHPEIGYFTAELFEPAKWKPSFPNLAFEQMDDGDAYWGAKIVTAFSDELIRRLAEAGEYSRAEVTRDLEDVLKQRRDAIGKYWLNRITPLEEITLTNSGTSSGVRFRDLAVERGYAQGAARSYRFWIENLKRRKLTKEQAANGPRTELALSTLSEIISKLPAENADEYGRTPLVRLVVQSKWTEKEWARPTEVFIGRTRSTNDLEVLGWTHAPR